MDIEDIDVNKYLGEIVYFKWIDPDGLIWIREAQVAQVDYHYRHWDYDRVLFWLDPDFGQCKDEKRWIRIEHECAIFMTKKQCLDSIYENIKYIKDQDNELKESIHSLF